MATAHYAPSIAVSEHRVSLIQGSHSFNVAQVFSENQQSLQVLGVNRDFSIGTVIHEIGSLAVEYGRAC
jgi:hypothetical protein